MYICVENSLGIDEKRGRLLINIGGVIVWFGSIVYRCISVAYVCVSFSIGNLISVGLAIMLLAVATPAMPFGGATTAAILL